MCGRNESGRKGGRAVQGDVSLGRPRLRHKSEVVTWCCGGAAGQVYFTTALKVRVAQSCPTFCDPMDCSLPVSSVHGILQARILEWVAFSSPGVLPNPEIEPRSPAWQADSL